MSALSWTKVGARDRLVRQIRQARDQSRKIWKEDEFDPCHEASAALSVDRAAGDLRKGSNIWRE
jgi:hypothetical protein